jgi:signal transduction histidine kinase
MAERLETNERRRRELLADVAHELRTPLQVIRGEIEGMLDGLYPADPDRLRPILDETLVMARLLEDLRTLSMAQEGVLQLEIETVDPRALVEETVRSFETLAGSKAVTVTVDTGSAPPAIDVDPVRIGEVLSNLLSNAIRHTPSGGRVDVEIAGGYGDLQLQVSDTGAGIPDDELSLVFDRFVRSADTGGTGLGLPIAKRLVEAHGGTIEALRNEGGGTRMRITIPTRSVTR